MRESDVLRDTYLDRATVKRNQETKVYGETKLVPLEVVSGLACAVSQSGRGRFNTAKGREKTDVSYDAMLFCQADADLRAGDLVDVTRQDGRLESYKAGKPYAYPSHLEVPLLLEAEA